MAIPRATGMLRTQIRRPLVGAVSPLRSSIQQVRAQSGTPPDGDIGGPYGQEPPPKKPGGASDVFQRNWAAVGGVALVLVGGYAYMSGGGPKSKDKGKEVVDTAKERAQELKEKGQEGLRKVEGKVEGRDTTGVDQLSGRKANMGGFRGE